MWTEREIRTVANEIALHHSGRSLEMSSPRDREDYMLCAKSALDALERTRQMIGREQQERLDDFHN